MSNSSLISYTKLSPNCDKPRNHTIDTITIHTMAGNCTVETLGNIFIDPNRGASSNYGIGSDGRIALYVDEANRSWCSSSRSNDNRAVTIEVASITSSPDYMPSSEAYTSLINLIVDICKRNGIPKLLWQGDKSLIGQVDKQNMTAHRWFKNKACPGGFFYDNMGTIAETVNAFLATPTATTVKATNPVNNDDTVSAENTVSDDANNELKMWNFLIGKGLNEYATAGLMGNIYAESGIKSNNLQNSYEKKLGYTDDEYTNAVDNGTYTNFVKDSAGYGLAQWTYYTRKQKLLSYANSANKSIGDFDMQCDYLWLELQGYKVLMETLKTATSIKVASDAVLTQFEKPADQSDTVKTRRAGYGTEIYNRHHTDTKATADTTNTKRVPYIVKVIVDGLRIRTGAGTSYTANGSVTKNVQYTITEEKNGFGKLKSGAGWISINEKYVTWVKNV
jgi:hypothetical protein